MTPESSDDSAELRGTPRKQYWSVLRQTRKSIAPLCLQSCMFAKASRFSVGVYNVSDVSQPEVVVTSSVITESKTTTSRNPVRPLSLRHQPHPLTFLSCAIAYPEGVYRFEVRCDTIRFLKGPMTSRKYHFVRSRGTVAPSFLGQQPRRSACADASSRASYDALEGLPRSARTLCGPSLASVPSLRSTRTFSLRSGRH